MVQAALSDGVAFDPFAFEEDCLAAPEVDVGRGEIFEALVVSAMIVMLHEGRDLRFDFPGEPGELCGRTLRHDIPCSYQETLEVYSSMA